MAARRKTTRKKKPVKEASYKVTKTRSDVGTSDTDEETVDAKSGAEAAEKAMKGDPRAGGYEKIEIERDKGGTGRVKTEPRTVSKVTPKTEPQTGFESVEFPYNIGVPMGFKALFDALPKKLTESLTFGDRYGKLHITVPDAKVMAKLMTEVEKKARGKTAVKNMAGSIAHGINESVKR